MIQEKASNMAYYARDLRLREQALRRDCSLLINRKPS